MAMTKRKRMTTEERFESKFTPVTECGCWLWEAGLKDKSGREERGSFYFRGRATSAPRASYEIYVGAIPDGLCVLHHCDVPLCVNPAHLYVGTKQDNKDDQMRRGRTPTPSLGKLGEASPNHTFTDAEVASAKQRHRAGESQGSIARSLHISQGTVSRWVRGERYGHVA